MLEFSVTESKISITFKNEVNDEILQDFHEIVTK